MWSLRGYTELWYPIRFRLLATLFIFGTVQPVRAEDAGESFTNNLITDLGPILALFGEQVTKQFLTQTFTMWDCVTFAMCPIGIITAIVSVIRVAAPTWLKAIVGRARESDALAELELLSSTSSEVCELWNGHAIVRDMGSPQILQVFCSVKGSQQLYALNGPENDDGPFRLETDGPPPNPESPDSAEDKRATYAPNISLNLDSRIQPTAHNPNREIAILGVMVQLLILLYGGLICYYPTWTPYFKKDGNATVSAAYPLVLVGTLLVDAGLFICAMIIEQSTNETTWKMRSKDSREEAQFNMVWLQKGKVVNDQSFQSYAIFASGQKSELLTSHPITDERDITFISRQTWTLIGAAASLVGYILQFFGLRFMHWSATIAQLIGMAIMTFARVWIRRSLSARPFTQQIPEGYEMDWFALQFGKHGHRLWADRKAKGEQRPVRTFWLSAPSENPDEIDTFSQEKPTSEKPQETSKGNDQDHQQAETAIITRERLRELSLWTGRASEPAIALAAATEEVMNILSSSLQDTGNDFGWHVWVEVNDIADEGTTNLTHYTFKLDKTSGKWRATATKLEAALSLWLYSEAYESSKSGVPDRSAKSNAGTLRRRDIKSKKQCIRLLASEKLDTRGVIRRDLLWWGGRGALELVKPVGHCGPPGDNFDRSDLSEIHPRHVLGFRQLNPAENLLWPGRPKRKDLHNGHSLWFAVGQDGHASKTLGVVSESPVEMLYAQDMFLAFMWAVSKALKDRIHDETTSNTVNESVSWDSFRLENSTLRKLALAVQQAGLATLDEAWTLIIPPLSFHRRLPQPDIIIARVREYVRKFERTNQWEGIVQTYHNLWEIFEPSGPQDDSYCKTAAIIVHTATFIGTTLTRYEMQKRSVYDINELKEAQRKFTDLVERIDCNIRHCLAEVYDLQHRSREWLGLESAPEHEGKDEPKFLRQSKQLASMSQVADRMRDIFGWTMLHYAVSLERPLYKGMGAKADPTARDVAEWTPLHYAAEKGSTQTISELLQYGASLDIQGRDGMSALHCAAKSGNEHAVNFLIEAGANEGIRDNSRSTPLHWASWCRHVNTVDALLGKGAYSGARDDYGRTPLHLAALTGSSEVAEKLLSGTSAYMLAKDRDGNTALHLAATYEIDGGVVADFITTMSSEKQMEELFSSLNNDGDTPLHMAVRYGCCDTLSAIISRLERPVAYKNPGGQSAIHLAAALGKDDRVRMILDKTKADVADTDHQMNTALHFAVFYGRVNTVKLLVRKYGADKNRRNTRGYYPQTLAEAM